MRQDYRQSCQPRHPELGDKPSIPKVFKAPRFDPRFCCAHQWNNAGGTQVREICDRCRATCLRDTAGRIVEYSVPAPTYEQQRDLSGHQSD